MRIVYLLTLGLILTTGRFEVVIKYIYMFMVNEVDKLVVFNDVY